MPNSNTIRLQLREIAKQLAHVYSTLEYAKYPISNQWDLSLDASIEMILGVADDMASDEDLTVH